MRTIWLVHAGLQNLFFDQPRDIVHSPIGNPPRHIVLTGISQIVQLRFAPNCAKRPWYADDAESPIVGKTKDGHAMLALALLTATPVFPAAAQTPPSKGKVLIVLSGETLLPLEDGRTFTTGYYLYELSVPAPRLCHRRLRVGIHRSRGDRLLKVDLQRSTSKTPARSY